MYPAALYTNKAFAPPVPLPTQRSLASRATELTRKTRALGQRVGVALKEGQKGVSGSPYYTLRQPVYCAIPSLISWVHCCLYKAAFVDSLYILVALHLFDTRSQRSAHHWLVGHRDNC